MHPAEGATYPQTSTMGSIHRIPGLRQRGFSRIDFGSLMRGGLVSRGRNQGCQLPGAGCR